MNYYNEIRNKLVDNEINKRVKDYSKNKYELEIYYEVGKLLTEAGKHYGEGIITEYSIKLSNELGKKYSVRYLFDIKRLYSFLKVHPLGAQLTISHCRILFSVKDDNKLNYYINKCIDNNLTKRELREIIKSKEYERLPESTKSKLKSNKNNYNVVDFVPNPIIIRNKNNLDVIKEKVLQKIILEDLDFFLKELGLGFMYVGHEYKIKIGNNYNFIDILLYNIKYRCYVVVELKTTRLKKEHIGQVMIYMNYVDKNIKEALDNKTIGLIVSKEGDDYIIKYSSDNRIYNTSYVVIN